MAAHGGVTVAACALGAQHPECGSIPDNQGLIRQGNDVRRGPGRRWPRKVEPVAVVGAGLRWHCIETLPRAELLVIFEMHVLGLQTFLPLYLPPPVAGQAASVLEPAFPRYVLVRFSLGDPAWRRIHSRPGVLRLLQHDAERPMVVRDGEVERLLRRYGPEGDATVSQGRPEWAPMATGVAVMVTDGPFAGFAGRVVHDMGARVRIEVDCFGQPTECELPRVAVDAA